MFRSLASRCSLLVLFVLLAGSAGAATFNVTNTNDTGAGSLRQAILDANAAAGADTITFTIPGAGVHTITPVTALPSISDTVTIDGYTQPGSSANTNALNAGINAVLQIQISNGPSNVGGIFILASAPGTTLRGLVINGSNGDDIDSAANDVTIAGNFIGTNSTGTAAVPGTNGNFALRISAGNTAHIGGMTVAEANLISGSPGGSVIMPFPSTTGHVIQGNYIGTDVTGTLALNTASGTTIGIDLAANTSIIGNLISGNGGTGVETLDNATLFNNLIGTQRDGASPLPNHNAGGVIIQGNGSTVGGSFPGQANIIAFNTGSGVGVQTNTSANLISQNSIYSNSQLGITLLTTSGMPLANDVGDTDAVPGNHGQNYPVITAVSIAAGSATVSGTINSNPATALHLEFFSNAACDASGNGEGQTFIGATDVLTDGSGNASFSGLAFTVPSGQGVITSTATNAAGDTSEYSQCPAAVPAATSTTVVSSLNPSTVGQSVTFTATVTGAAPTGTVQFKDGASDLGSPVALSGAVAALTTSVLTQGTHSITAVYSGDSGNATSTSPGISQVVDPLPAGGSSTSLVSSANPSLVGQSVTFTATVTGSSPTGTVQFKDGASNLGGPIALSAGVATLNTSSLAAGTHPITALYAGDANNAASTSPTLVQNVNAVGAPSPVPAQPIPTLSAWAMMLLLILMGVAALSRMRRPDL